MAPWEDQAVSSKAMKMSIMNSYTLVRHLPLGDQVTFEGVEASGVRAWDGGERDSDELLRRIQPHLCEILGRLLHWDTSINPQFFGREEALPQERITAQSPTARLASEDGNFLGNGRIQRHAQLRDDA